MEERTVVGWRCVGVVVNMILDRTMRVRVIGWGGVLRIESGNRGVSWAVLPVQMGVHGGESDSRQRPDGFLSQLDFIFLSCNMGFKQNKPKFVGSLDLFPFREASHPL